MTTIELIESAFKLVFGQVQRQNPYAWTLSCVDCMSPHAYCACLAEQSLKQKQSHSRQGTYTNLLNTIGDYSRA